MPGCTTCGRSASAATSTRATAGCRGTANASGARRSTPTSSPRPRSWYGLLNDDTTDVGRVHLGVVFIADAGGRPVAIRETGKLTGCVRLPGEVRAVGQRLETWSQLVFERLDDPAAGAVRL
jgi:hypothetical protein